MASFLLDVVLLTYCFVFVSFLIGVCLGFTVEVFIRCFDLLFNSVAAPRLVWIFVVFYCLCLRCLCLFIEFGCTYFVVGWYLSC